jgi:hypothetical protein
MISLFYVVFSSLEQESNGYQYHVIPGEEFNELPDQTIYSIAEDSTGLLWFSTSLGLYKFDGYNYDLVTIPSKKGRAVFEFKVQGRKVLFSNVYGQLFETEKDSAKLIIDLSDLSSGSVPKFVNRENHLYVGLKSGLFFIDGRDKRAISNDYILGLTSQFNRVLFVNDQGLLKSLDQSGNIETLEGLKGGAQRINHLSFAERPSDERLLFYQIDGVNHFKLINKFGKLISLEIPEVILRLNINHVYIEKVKFRSFIVSTEQGCYRLSFLKNGSIATIETLLSTDYNCTSALEERGGDIMISTMNNGFFVLPNQKLEYLNVSDVNEIETFTVLNNHSFVTGSINGVLRIYKEASLSSQIQLPNHAKIEKIVYLRNADLLLINTNSNYGYTYQIKDGILKENKHLVATKDLYTLTDSTVLHATFDRLSLVDLWEGTETKELINSRTMRVVFDSTIQCFYAATLQGVYAFDKRLDHFRKIKSEDNIILLDLEIVDGKVFGFSNNQLFIIKNGSLKQIAEFKGVLKDIEGDDKGDIIWISTTNGIISYNLTTGEYDVLPVSKDLLGEVNRLEYRNSTLYFSDRRSIYRLKKNELVNSKGLDFRPVLNRLLIKGESVVFKENYSLTYDQSDIRLEFGLNRYNSSKSMIYYYKLNASDNEEGDWLKLPEGINYIQLTSLAAGDYTVLVYAESKAGRRSEVSELVHFSVLPPFWQRWWFYLLIGTSVLLMAFIIISKRLSIREKRKNEELSLALYKQRTALLQLENLRSQMNPHFIFNALNSIQDYIVLNERKLASSFLVKFSRLIRIYLEQGQQNEIYLKQEIEALRLYLELEKVRFEEELTYEIIIDDELDLTTIKIPSLLIQPYIENALKHGLLHKKSDRSLSVRFSLKSSKVLECIIEDNGVGRSVSHDINLSRKEHRSFATQATEKRVELINEVKSNNDKIQIKIDDLFSATLKPNGTRVNILIPFK